MGGRRIGLVAIALVLTLPLLLMSTASASSAPSLSREPIPIRLAIAHGPLWVSGVVSMRYVPRTTPATGTLAVDADVTIWPIATDYRVTNDPNAQNEVSIAMNPRNGYNLVASANDYRGYPGLPPDGWCGVYSTFNGGRTWIEQRVPRNGPLTQATVSGDPSVAFDADGNAYIECLGFSRTTNDNVLTVTRSSDGGRTWGTAALVEGTTANVFHDKPYIAVDRSSGPTRNFIYVTWTRFMGGSGECGPTYSAPIYFSRSIDGGATFSPPMEISSPGYRCSQGSEPAVGPAGELYVSWVTGSRAVVVKSTDAGVTWGSPRTIPMQVPNEVYGGSPRTPHFPSIAVNPINAPDGSNRVHVVWADRRYGTPDILMSTSVDGGLTFGAAVRVNDDARNAQFFPWVAASNTGKVFVSFYDQRDDPNGRLLNVYVTVSSDFGATFQKNLRASAQFDPGNWFIGDYNGLTASADFAYPVWCDLRNGGNEEVYMAGPPMLYGGLGGIVGPGP